MEIENLLAQGVQIRPEGMARNALMQYQQFQDAKQKNALMQMEMQDMHAQRQQALQAALRAAEQKRLQDAEFDRVQSGGQLDPVAMSRAGIPQAQIEFLANRGNLGRAKVARTLEEQGPNGAPQTIQFDEHGGRVGQPIAKPVQLTMQDLGGRVLPVNPFTQTEPMAKTMTPDGRDASARGWADIGLKRDAQNKPTWDATNGGYFDPKTRTFTLANGPDGKPLGSKGGGTVDERNAAGYSSRMAEATKLLDQYETEGRATRTTNAAGDLPFVGSAARTAVMDSKQQMYRQAQEDWVRAKLRKESGAAIGADEMDREILTYFPQPGELTGTVEQKRRSRLIANEAMARSSGKAAYTSEVPAPVAPAFTTPANLNADAMELLRRADAIVSR